MNYITLIGFIIGIILGGTIFYLIFKKRLNKKIELDNSIISEYENKKQLIQKDIENLQINEEQYKSQLNSTKEELNFFENKRKTASKEAYEAELKINSLETKRQEILKSLDLLKQQQENAAEKFYSQAKYIAEQSFEQEINKISSSLENNRKKAQEDYLNTLKDCADSFQREIEIRQKELSQLDQELADLRQIVSSAVEARRREEAAATDKNFYRLQLSDIDKQEIKKLREVLPFLRNAEPLNKVIYDFYYKKPYTDLVGRVIGKEQKSGIYKITNLENGMAYVGKSVNLSERFKQHIKRGVGADTPTNNKLYPAMYEFGPENFTFEIIEECSPDLLSEREQFWQDYFQVKIYGYSMK